MPVKQATRKLRYLICWRHIWSEFISSGSTILLCSLCMTRSPTALLSVVVLFRLLLCSKISSFQTSSSMLSRINTNLHSLTKLPVNPRFFFEIQNLELIFPFSLEVRRILLYNIIKNCKVLNGVFSINISTKSTEKIWETSITQFILMTTLRAKNGSGCYFNNSEVKTPPIKKEDMFAFTRNGI